MIINQINMKLLLYKKKPINSQFTKKKRKKKKLNLRKIIFILSLEKI